MSFSQIEESKNLGVPVNLYFIRYGGALNSYYAYTDADESIVFEGIEYLPGTISRDSIKVAGGLDKSNLEIFANFNSNLANLFLIYAPSYVVSLTIRQGHLSDPDEQFLVIWKGRILSSNFKGNEISLTCEPIITSLNRPGLRRNYQYGCPHVLYGNQCRASKEQATDLAVVASVVGAQIFLTTGWNSFPQDKYVNGLIEWQDLSSDINLRSILRNVGPNIFLLNGQVPSLRVGQQVKVSLGCSRKTDDCLNLHNNIHNFGGFISIPEVNPLSNQNQYY